MLAKKRFIKRCIKIIKKSLFSLTLAQFGEKIKVYKIVYKKRRDIL